MLPSIVHNDHVFSGHIGQRRLLNEIVRRYSLPDFSRTNKLTREITRNCENCQANEHPHQSTKYPMTSTPVPPVPMDNIAIDVFYINSIKYDGKEYDALVIIVDRLTGWITVILESRNGLIARRVARQVCFIIGDFFGVPRVVVSDKGPQFASAFLANVMQSFRYTKCFLSCGISSGKW